MQKTLEQFPLSKTNNARAIMRKKLEKMRDFPSEKRANDLEHNFGIVSDWSDKDYGEPPYQDKEN
jgi:hypothetical protein